MEDEGAGTESLEILINLGVENSFSKPENLQKLERIAAGIMEVSNEKVKIGKIISLVDVIKEINRALNENRMEAYEIPDKRELISQELLLFENSGREDLEQLVDASFATARVVSKLSLPKILSTRFRRFPRGAQR